MKTNTLRLLLLFSAAGLSCNLSGTANPALTVPVPTVAPTEPPLPVPQNTRPAQQPPASPDPNVAPPTLDPGALMYTQLQTQPPLEQGAYLAQINSQSAATSAWAYQTSFVATTPSGEPYDIGCFCRIFERADGQGFDVIYGGAFGEKYNGDVYRVYDTDLNAQTSPMEFSPTGGDLAIDSDGQSYYLLVGHPEGWSLRKFDGNFDELGQVVIALPVGHVNNDQMLRVHEGLVYASSLYDPAVQSAGQAPPKPGPDEDVYTHVWVYDTDLNYVADYVLDDHGNINGGTLLNYDRTFAYVAADNFFRNNLVALLYDDQWNYLETKLLQPDSQWAMGGVASAGQLFVAYHRGGHGQGDVLVNIYDTDWNLHETIEVTKVASGYNAQRPWVQIIGDRLFVSYDLGREPQGILDFQCMVSVYARR